MASVEEYLRYIGVDAVRAPSREFLRELHVKHLQKIPFENLDIKARRPIELSEPAILHKILQRNRGGFCYELNGAFAWLLEQLGFNIARLSARVTRASGDLGPDFDHLTLLVHLDEDYIADVGYGTSSNYPLPLDGTTIENTLKPYRLRRTDDNCYVSESLEDGKWHREYQFTLADHPLSAFNAMCAYHQTSPESNFVKGSLLCTRATSSGRIWIRDYAFVEATALGRSEKTISDEERIQLFQQHFAIDITE